MDSAQEMSSQDQDNLAGDVMESLGEPREAGEDVSQSHEDQGGQGVNDPLYVQKRLKQQKRAHDREMREMQARMAEMHSMMNSPAQSQETNPYQAPTGSVDEQIHKAVSYALQHKEMEERKAKEAEHAAHINQQYQDLHHHLDRVSDKYDDFDDVVRAGHMPFTEHMKNAALFLPQDGPGSAGEVLYKLGKNKSELERIARLHPLEQVRELNKLSRSLEVGGEKQASNQQRPLGNIKNNPVVNSHSVTDKTSVSDLRKRMRAGWK